MVIQNPEHYELVAYRWVDVRSNDVERLHSVAQDALTVTPSPRGGFIAQVELLTPEDTDVVRRAVNAMGDSMASRGTWLSVASEFYEDSMLADALVRDLIVDVGGRVDFSFTALPLDDETNPAVAPIGTHYALLVPHIHADQLSLLVDAISIGSLETDSRDKDGAIHALVNLETDADCRSVANVLTQMPLLSRPTIVASIVTCNDSDGIEMDSCIIDLLRLLRCDLQLSYSVVDSDERDCADLI